MILIKFDVPQNRSVAVFVVVSSLKRLLFSGALAVNL